ncbi:uncharacterized protein TRIADDRAFT_25104 [Trichoplax adhaerens]|uniref:Kringle domain-containing protein n=1 Tax=Trichoplax adhaerens TaxID=10228 RepID=B3RXM8_TRIAD|nr:hypothetical protein TRIADDRAFT_25104 [Trichoplax adhaerens]EDV24456.1 hypothetical protein TRIADDRAFT_25104 [Trichoplax adhaerens]|eukprot:XP_002112346.1 hypothetical protein TRIADDRAFT_25104 [Trichoplax adhaerens]
MPTEESIQFYPITRECMLGKGTTYRGGQDRTKSGLICQNWLSQYPHRHSFTPAAYPEFGLGDHNYCRNPDNSNDGPWCFTSSISRRSEACSVPRCGKTLIF